MKAEKGKIKGKKYKQKHILSNHYQLLKHEGFTTQMENGKKIENVFSI